MLSEDGRVIVMKFGGTSMGDADRLSNAIEIISEHSAQRPVIIVSALPGVTNDLVAASAAARAQNVKRVSEIVHEIRIRHEEIAISVVERKSDFLDSFLHHLKRQIEEIDTVLRGIALLGEMTSRARDKVTSMGARLSSILCAYALMMRALPGEHVSAEDVIWSDDHFGEATPLMNDTREAARRVLLPLLERQRIPVMGGLIARTRAGATTTLGRNGADYTATIVGAAIGATEVQLWTDTDGLMTCDPRLVPGARVIDELSFREAAEFTLFGAKLNPHTLEPAAEAEIPVRVQSTLNPSSPGTRISASGIHTRTGARFIASVRNVTIVKVTAHWMIDQAHFLERIFAQFEELEISADFVEISEGVITVAVQKMTDPETLLQRLQAADAELIEDQCIVSVVGQRLLDDARVRMRLLESLHGVAVKMISLGKSGMSLRLLVSDADADNAVRWIHHALFEGD
jgi:aspartate kinase